MNRAGSGCSSLPASGISPSARTRYEGTVEEIDLAIHAHPTLSEAIAEAVLDSMGKMLHA